jgi:hypothetical protein
VHHKFSEFRARFIHSISISEAGEVRGVWLRLFGTFIDNSYLLKLAIYVPNTFSLPQLVLESRLEGG